jgi:acetyltransferase
MQIADNRGIPQTPYPDHLIHCWRLVSGRVVTVRPVRPQDGELEQDFIRSLSPKARYYRFFNAIRELSPELLWQLTHVDYRRSMTLLAVVRDGGREAQLGVAQYVADQDAHVCDFALVIHDAWQGHGLGSLMLHTLEQRARAAGLTRMEADVIADNQPMLRLARSRGFAVRINEEDPSLLRVSKTLAEPVEAQLRFAQAAERVPCSA